MNIKLYSIVDFFLEIQASFVDLCNSYGLLKHHIPRDSKKILLYLFVQHFNEKIKTRDTFFYFTGTLPDNLEVFEYFDKEKFCVFFRKICEKIRKLTKRIILLKNIPDTDLIDNGEIKDELVLLRNYDVDPQKLKEVLHSLNLSQLFSELSKKVY